MAQDILSELDRLIETLGGAVARAAHASPVQNSPAATPSPVMPRDAIEAVLASPPRQTAIAPLREAPEVQAFRDALLDGLIRVDTANRLLRLVNDIILRAGFGAV